MKNQGHCDCGWALVYRGEYAYYCDNPACSKLYVLDQDGLITENGRVIRKWGGKAEGMVCPECASSKIAQNLKKDKFSCIHCGYGWQTMLGR